MQALLSASVGALAMVAAILAALCPGSAVGLNFAKQQTNKQVLSVHRLRIVRDNGSEPVANLTLFFCPETQYNIREEQVVNISFAYSLQSSVDLNGTFRLDNERVAVILGPRFLFEANATADEALELAVGNASSSSSSSSSSNQTFEGQLPYSLQVLGTFLGRSELTLTVRDPAATDGLAAGADGPGRELETSLRYRLSVIRKRRPIDEIVQIAIWSFVILANVGMGCELDMRVVRTVLKKPVAPILGFVSQYIFMPLVSFCVLLVIDLPASTALGYFGMGCAPGGGASNFYCLLLGGDISLSITMTLISTLTALGMTPMYMLTLGQHILKSRNIDIQIPYANIVLSLLVILVPTAIGYVIKLKLPRVARIYRRVLKPAVLVFMVFMFTGGVYANLFIWQLFSPAIIAAGCALPYAGFLLGGLLAAIFRQPWPYVKTISLETGIQNAGVPILILQSSLPQPDADLSLVGPFAAGSFTPLPLFLWVAGRFIYYRCYLKRSMFAKPEAQVEIGMDGGDGGAAAAGEPEEAGPFIAAGAGFGENGQVVKLAVKDKKKKRNKGWTEADGSQNGKRDAWDQVQYGNGADKLELPDRV